MEQHNVEFPGFSFYIMYHMDRAEEASNPEMLKRANTKKVSVFPKDQEKNSLAKQITFIQ